jgi:hypothetical protein
LIHYINLIKGHQWHVRLITASIQVPHLVDFRRGRGSVAVWDDFYSTSLNKTPLLGLASFHSAYRATENWSTIIEPLIATSLVQMPLAAQNKDGAIHVDESQSTLGTVGRQLLPFLIGGGSGIVSTTMYAVRPVKAAHRSKSIH